MSFVHIQSPTQVQTGSTATTVAIPCSAVVAGDLVVVNIKIVNTADVSPTCTDNATTPNTYALAATQVTSGNGNVLYQFYGVAQTGGATTITVNWTGSFFARIDMEEFSGNAPTNALVFDQGASNFGATATASSATIKPSRVGELIVAGVDQNSTVTATTAGANYVLDNSGSGLLGVQHRLSGTTSETAPMTWTTSSSWEEVVGAYYPAQHVKFNNSGLRPHPFSPGLAR